MKYISANDQEGIWDTCRTMASHPELQLSRRFLRVPGYGSLWHPGRGWIALPRCPISRACIFSILRFQRAGSRSEVMYWSSLCYGEEEKAGLLKRLAIEKASNMMCAAAGMGEEEKAGLLKRLAIEKASNVMSAAAGMGDISNWDSDSDSSKGIFDSVLEPALDAIQAFIGSKIDLSEEVHGMPNMVFFMCFCRGEAKLIDLSKEVHLLARIEHALSKMHNELSAMLFIMPSFASLMYTRPIIEITGLLNELDQLVLQRAKRRTSVLSLPYVWRGKQCLEGFFAWIFSNLLEGVAIHFIDEAILYARDTDELKQPFLEQSDNQSKDIAKSLRGYDVVAAKAEGDRLRNEFLERAELKPPQVLRMIDCRATRKKGRVVLKDWKDCKQARGYSAISHTYGQDVYQVFNCTCASICRAAQKPRCSFDACPHDPAAPNAEHTATQTRVVKEILNMCGTLHDAGVRYAWHDGVCIAQHDEAEVRHTIEHIGWVYSNGRETIVFLHYVGKPMAPIRVSMDEDEMVCRWHTRVWTLQEAALSKHRRYCIRMGKEAIGECESLVDFIKNVGLCESSSVEVVEEERFFEILIWLHRNLLAIPKAALEIQSPFIVSLLNKWEMGIYVLIYLVMDICFSFPTVDDTIWLSTKRESKHRGDRMSSILTLVGVKPFEIPKDSNVEPSPLEFFEAYTLTFFEKQGQKGLARALFGINCHFSCRCHNDPVHGVRMHQWLPVLGNSLNHWYEDGVEDGMRLRVLRNGRLEVKPGDGDELLCYKVQIHVVNSPGYEYDAQHEFAGEVESLITKAKLMLDMNLVVSGAENLIYLSQGPSYHVGALATSLKIRAVRSTRLVNPSNSDGDHRLLGEEESFDAHLVTTNTANSKKMLLLQGNDILSGEVSKIGVFLCCYPSIFKQLMLTSNIKPERIIII